MINKHTHKKPSTPLEMKETPQIRHNYISPLQCIIIIITTITTISTAVQSERKWIST